MELIYLTLTIGLYLFNQEVQKRSKLKLYNPLLITSLMLMVIFYFYPVYLPTYQANTQILTLLITPATVALAIPLYKYRETIKKNIKPLALGITGAVVSHALVLGVLSKLLKLNNVLIASLTPKSVTTAIAKEIAFSLRGEPSITIPVVIITGILGSILSESLRSILKIESDAAHGLALGASAHAMGTSKALEEGEVEGVYASIALVLTGLVTVALSPLIYTIITNI